MAQEHRDQIMIQKTLRGTVEPQDQQEIDRIGHQRNAKNKGEAIQKPPLHEALVEVHKEYAKASRAAKDMAEMYKKGTAATEILNNQCMASQVENHRLSEQLREKEEITKKINEEALRRPDESIQECQQKYQQAEEALKQAKEKAVLLESQTKEMEEQQHSTLTEFGNQLREKDNTITRLRR